MQVAWLRFAGRCRLFLRGKTASNTAAPGEDLLASIGAIEDARSYQFLERSAFTNARRVRTMWRRGLHAKGGIHEPERRSRSPPARLCDSTQARPSKMPSIHRRRRGLPGRRLHHRGNPRCGSKLPLDALWRLFLGNAAFAQAGQKIASNRLWSTADLPHLRASSGTIRLTRETVGGGRAQMPRRWFGSI